MPQQSARIVEAVHDEPHIEGSRISVWYVYQRVHERGLRPETVAERHDLDIADVYNALAYYHDHPEEIAAVEARREQAMAESEARSTISPPDE